MLDLLQEYYGQFILFIIICIVGSRILEYQTPCCEQMYLTQLTNNPMNTINIIK